MVDRHDPAAFPELGEDGLPDQQFLEPGTEGLGDEEAELMGEPDMGLGLTLSAEEAAMRIVDEPGGMNYDPDPGYITD